MGNGLSETDIVRRPGLVAPARAGCAAVGGVRARLGRDMMRLHMAK
jgi:hypothetical protein